MNEQLPAIQDVHLQTYTSFQTIYVKGSEEAIQSIFKFVSELKEKKEQINKGETQ